MFANTGFPAILLPAIARFYFTLETCLQYIQFVQLQGVQRIYERFCKYKAINQKVNNQAIKFLTF